MMFQVNWYEGWKLKFLEMIKNNLLLQIKIVIYFLNLNSEIKLMKEKIITRNAFQVFTQKASHQHLAILKLQNFYFRSFSAFELKIFSFTQNSFRFMFSPRTFFSADIVISLLLLS